MAPSSYTHIPSCFLVEQISFATFSFQSNVLPSCSHFVILVDVQQRLLSQLLCFPFSDLFPVLSNLHCCFSPPLENFSINFSRKATVICHTMHRSASSQNIRFQGSSTHFFFILPSISAAICGEFCLIAASFFH